LSYRCVKCTDSHATKDCPKKTRDESPKCCNCGGSHPASYRQCKEREKYLLKLRDRQNQLKSTTQPIKTNPVDGRAWNHVAAGKPQITMLKESNKDETTSDMLAILMTIKSIKSQFISCNSMMDKVILIMTHLGQYV